MIRTIFTKTNNASSKAHSASWLAFSILLIHHVASAAQGPVDLGTAGHFAILSKSGISTVPPSAVTGNLGVSPIDSSAITGFSLTLDSSGQFSTSAQVTGQVFGPDYASPTPVNLTTAVGDMQTAYTDAAGRTLPDHTELGSGDIGGLTLDAGLYKWSTDVTIPANVTLFGGPNDVWIFQIAGNLSIASGKAVVLSGGAQAQNVFWQVAGGVGVDLGSTSQFAGTILAQAAINMQTSASINGRLLAQTAVTLDANAISVTAVSVPLSFASIGRATDGTVTLAILNTPNLPLTLQVSTNLTSWTTLTTLTPTNSPYIFTDTKDSADRDLFYRAFYN